MSAMMRKTTLTLASLALAAGLAACSNSLESTGSLPGSSTTTSSASASATSAATTASATPSPTVTSVAPTSIAPEPTTAAPTTQEATTSAPTAAPSLEPTTLAPASTAPAPTKPVTTQAAPNPANNAALQQAIADGAFAGAGGAVPAGTGEATVSASNGARVITTGRGLVRCDLEGPNSSVAVMCSTESSDSLVEKFSKLNPNAQLSSDYKYFVASTAKIMVDPAPGVQQSGDVFPNSSAGTDAATATNIQTIEYGQTVYYGNGACHAESNAMTCWDTTTGHGFFLNNANYGEF